MGLDIVTNVMAQQASNDLSTNQSNMQSSLEKLSSGYNINTAADDASGLVISQHLQAQIGAFQQAQSNTQAGINVVQTASGALTEVSTILQRINTLAVESQNSSATDATAQQAAQSEVDQALESITDIAATTVYGNNQLLSNSANPTANVNYTFQTGYDGSTSSQVTFNITALNLANLGLVNQTMTGVPAGSGISSLVGNVPGGGANAYTLQTNAAAGANVTATGGTWAAHTFTTGAQVGGYTFKISVDGGPAVTVTLAASTAYTNNGGANDIATLINNTLAANGQTATVSDAGSAAAGLTLTSNAYGTNGNIVLTEGTGGVAQLGLTGDATVAGKDAQIIFGGATPAPVTVNLSQSQDAGGQQVAINLGSGMSVLANVANGGVLTNAATAVTQPAFTAANLNTTNYSVTAANAVTVIQNAIATVSSMQGQFGAYQNELQSISDNETVGIQNLTASNANIMDTNMASQMVDFTQDQVLVQAGVSMLAQANQIPQYVLKLLG